MSCNGCRVLRKACPESCALRDSLRWIKSDEAQANATRFLAKFYGRSGLINLLTAAGDCAVRPQICRSLLYEACGRIVNPIYGSVGLFANGDWQRCHMAVESVLKGRPLLKTITVEGDKEQQLPVSPTEACEIRHVSKEAGVDRRVRTRKRAKKETSMRQSEIDELLSKVKLSLPGEKFTLTGWDGQAAQQTESRSPERRPPDSEGDKTSSSPSCGGSMELELTLGPNNLLLHCS